LLGISGTILQLTGEGIHVKLEEVELFVNQEARAEAESHIGPSGYGEESGRR